MLIPVHPTVEEVGKRVVLLEQLVESASEKGLQNKECKLIKKEN